MNDNPVDTELLSGNYGLVSFVNADRREIQLTPRHINRYEVTFEMVATEGVLQSSEVLKDFRISYGARVAYDGRATVTSITPSGTRVLYSAALEEPWAESGLGNFDRATLGLGYDAFLDCWRRYYQVRPEFKVIVADMQSLLTDLELWLSQLEVGLDASGDSAMEELRLSWARELGGRTTATLNALFEKFESAAATAPPESRAAYRSFARRQLHPLLLCSPFLHRTYRKPLGYAGDFEMVNMITRDPHEGATLYAKLVNAWFLQQAPSEAHRNRLKHLRRRILEVAIQAAQTGRPARVLTLGCGPAVEIQEYLLRNQYPGLVEFTLVDFNQETLDQTRQAMERISRSHRQPARIEYVRKSVMTILKETTSAAHERSPYDFVYCAGLFDYLTDPVCRRLSTQLYGWLRTGGLFLSTNVHDSNPWPRLMDFIADWHLIYRSSEQMLATRPEKVDLGDCVLTADATGVNVFLEVRKMENRSCAE